MSNPGELLDQANAFLDRGELTPARELFARVCELDDGVAEAWLMLGAIDGEAGRVEEALRHIRLAIELDPDYEEAHLTLAGIQRHLGKLDEAMQSCARAVEIAPDYEEAWLLLSGIQGVLERYADSEYSSRRTIKLWPECVDAHVNLANALKAQGKWDEAVDSYRTVLQLDPNHQTVSANLGYVYLEQDRLSEASACFSGLLQRQPGSVDANLGMARLMLSLSDPESAITYCQTAQAEPGAARVQLALAEALVSANRLEDADQALSGIPAQDRETVAVVCMRARILERQGDYQQAFDVLNKYRDTYGEDAGFAVAFADTCRHLKRINAGTGILEHHLGRQSLSAGVRKQLHFSLGRLYDTDRQYDKAFGHFRRGNDLKPAVFDADAHRAAIDRLINTYSRQTLDRLPRASNASQQPIFIIGMPRSGSTLIEQILSSHSQVVGAGELPYIGQMTIALAREPGIGPGYPELVPLLTQDRLDVLAQSYLDKLQARSASAARITDKQNGNFLHLGLIQLLFPAARVIHCTRDPMDTCLSLYTHDMGGEATYTRSFEHLAFYYRQYQRLMSHWHAVLQVPILDISYEALIDDQEGKTRELLVFCDLPWEESCLEFYQNRRAVATPSHAQVRQPLYRGSVGRWRYYQAHFSPLQALLAG